MLRRQLIIAYSLVFLLSLAACAPIDTSTPLPTLVPTFTPTRQPSATHTATAVPSPTASATFSPEPLPTETPTPTQGLLWQITVEQGNVIQFLPELLMVVVGKRDGTVELRNSNSGDVLQTFAAHTGGVQALAFDFELGLLATGGRDQTIKLWQLFDGYGVPEEVATLTGHTNTVQGLVFPYGGNILVSASADGTARVWSLATQTTLFTLEVPGSAVWSVAVYGGTIATGHGDNVIRLWEANNGQLITTLEGHAGPVWSLAISSGFTKLASASSDGTIKIWQIGSQPALLHTLEGHGNTVWSVAFSPDGRTLVSGSDDASVRVWSMDDYAPLTSFETAGQPAVSVTFHSFPYLMVMDNAAPDELIFSALNADGTLSAWKLSNRPMPTPRPIIAASKTPTLAPQTAATASAPITSLTANGNIGISEITQAYWSNDGTRLIMLTPGAALIYDSQSLQKLFTVPVTGIAYLNPDGTLGIDDENTRTAWDVNTGAQISSAPLVSLKGIKDTFSDEPLMYHVAAQKLTVFIGYAKNGTSELPLVQAINRESGQIVFNGNAPVNIQLIDGAPFGSLVGINVYEDVIDDLLVLDLKSLQFLQQYFSVGYGESAFAFSADEQFVAVPNSDPERPQPITPGLVKISHLRSREVPKRFLLGSEAGDSIDGFDAIAFSPNDQRLGMVLGNQGWIWDLASGQLKYELKGFAGTAVRLQFSPDNKRALVATSRGLYLWNLP